MNDMIENIFDYDPDVLEIEVLKPGYGDKASYLQFTPLEKVQSDLHFLFLIRKDRDGCKRIMNKLRLNFSITFYFSIVSNFMRFY